MSTVTIDGETTTNLIVLIGAIITGLTSIIAAVFAGMASLRAGRAENISEATRLSSVDNNAKLVKIESQTNSLSHAVAQVAQTDANARLAAATAPPLPVASAPQPVVIVGPTGATPGPVDVKIVNPEPMRVTETAKGAT